MKKPYELHEIGYQKIKKKGLKTWADLQKQPTQIDADAERMLIDIMAQPWAPQSGSVLEVGCGTAPILRWFCNRGFSGVGIDVSRTALEMAKEQAEGLDARFAREDICGQPDLPDSSFDLVIDGFCLHCITIPEDRISYFRNIHRLLKPGGLLIIQTMCSPVNREAIKTLLTKQFLHKRVIYANIRDADAENYRDVRLKGNQKYIPTRYIDYWKNILLLIKTSGFQTNLFRVNRARSDEPCSDLTVAALKEEC